MVDTVKFLRRITLKANYPRNSWTLTERNPNKPYAYDRILQHFHSGMRVVFIRRTRKRSKNGKVKRATLKRHTVSVEASLPRVLWFFRHRAKLSLTGPRGKRFYRRANVKLIESQAELDRAFWKLDELIREISDPLISIPQRKFKRVDLTWMIKGNAADYIAAHYHMDHPGTKRGVRRPVIHRGETITWGTQKSECRLQIYDKFKEVGKDPGKIVRIELQLSGRKLNKLLGRGRSVLKLDIDECYQTLRTFMLRLHPRPLQRLPQKLDLAAWVVSQGYRIGDRPAIDVILESYKSEYRKKVEQRLRGPLQKAHRIDWSKIFPPKRPRMFFPHPDMPACIYTVPQE